jgi:hypothetical protein
MDFDCRRDYNIYSLGNNLQEVIIHNGGLPVKSHLRYMMQPMEYVRLF